MVKITIEINNITSQIVDFVGDDLSLALKDALSYSVTGAVFSEYAKVGMWDGTKNLYDAKRQVFPTGLLKRAISVIKACGYDFNLVDKREKPIGFPLILKNVKLRDYQEECVRDMVSKTRGLIQVGTSGGKSIILSALLANLGVNSLVIVPTKELLKQTAKAISDVLGVKVGCIGDGEKDIGKITVATFQSLTASKDVKKRKYDHTRNRWTTIEGKEVVVRPDLKEYLGNVECVLNDECFPSGIKVNTEKGYIDISKIVNQKLPLKVWSFNTEKQIFELKNILSYFKKPSPEKLVKIMFSKHSVVRATLNHPFYILKDNGITKVKAEELKEGDLVVSLPRKGTAKDNIPNALNDEQKQVVLGSILGDGSLRVERNGCRLSLCQGEAQKSYLDWKIRLLGNLITCNAREGKSGYCDNKVYSISTVMHPFMQVYSIKDEVSHVKKVLKDIGPLGLAIWFMDDGSRCYTNYYLHTESFCLDSQKLFVQFFKEKYNLCPSIRSYEKGGKKYYYLSFNTADSRIFERIISPFIHPCLQYKLIDCKAVKSPYTSNSKEVLYGVSQIKGVSIEKSKSPFVYNIEVEDNHNYLVGNNKLVSNCHHLSASSLQQIYDACPNAYYRYGCSATPFHDADEDVLIEAVTGRLLKRYSASYLIAHNWISKPFIHLIPFKQDRLPVGTKYAEAYEQRVIKNVKRNDLVRQLAEMEADKGNSVLISVRQINHGETIYKLLKDKYKDKVVFLNSKVASNKVSEVLQQLFRKEILIVIATSLINEGINVPSLDTLIFASCPKSPIVTMQLVGRVLRRTELKNTVNVYDIQDYGCKYLTSASKERVEIYKTEPEFVLQEDNSYIQQDV